MTASKPIFLYTKLLWTIVQVVERPMNILENDFDRFIAWARLSFIYETTAHSSHVLSVAVISVLLKWCYYTRIGFNNNRNNNKDQNDINKYNNFIRVDDLAKMPPPYFSALYTNTSLYSYSFFWTVFVSQLHFPSARIPSANLLVGPQTDATGAWCMLLKAGPYSNETMLYTPVISSVVLLFPRAKRQTRLSNVVMLIPYTEMKLDGAT